MQRKVFIYVLYCIGIYLLIYIIALCFNEANIEMVNYYTKSSSKFAFSRNSHFKNKNCTKLRFPDMTNFRSRWQKVSSTGTAYVYSVYKIGSTFRIMGAAEHRELFPFCQMWHKDSEGHVSLRSVHEAKIIYLPEDHKKRLISCYFLCPLSSSDEPFAVSVVLTDSCVKPMHALLVSSSSRISRGKFTVCLSPLYFQKSFATDLVEWIELNRILGADFFVFYNVSASKTDHQVLSYYSKRGIAEVHSWNLLSMNESIHNLAQMAAINDCILRHRHNTNFIAILDLDEFIIPRRQMDMTWTDMLKRLPKASSYIFRNVFFPIQWPSLKNDAAISRKGVIKIYGLLVLDKLKRESFIWENKMRSKTILNPRAIDISGIHFVWEHRKGNSVNVAQTIGLVHHYREWSDSPDRVTKVRDTTVLKYQDMLIERVQNTWKDINRNDNSWSCDLSDIRADNDASDNGEGYSQFGYCKCARFQGIRLQFMGCLNIYWTEIGPGTGNRCVDTKEFSASEEYLNIHQLLFEPVLSILERQPNTVEIQCLENAWDNDNWFQSKVVPASQGILYPDEHKFEFQFKLPAGLPESYEDDICLIEYYLEATIEYDDGRESDIDIRKDFYILNPLDLNNVITPDIRSPVGQQASQTLCCCCCTSLPINVTLRLRRSGYAQGESIKLYAEVENNSRRKIVKSFIRLMKERIYITSKKKRVEVDEMVKVERGYVEPKSIDEYHKVPIVIPRDCCHNVDSCQLFEIRYYLEMVVEPKRADSIILPPIQIVIGKIPLIRKSKKPPSLAKLKNAPPLEKLKKEKARKPEKSPRERRKVREQRVTPSEETDTSDYVQNPNRMKEDWTIIKPKEITPL